jgi:pilus assembly protein CpaB
VNPKQRRGVLLMALAVLGGIAVFGLVSRYVSDVRTQVEPLTPVLWLTEDVAIQQPVPDGAIEERMVPRRWVPTSALRSRSELEGLVAATALPAGSILQDGMVRERPELGIGEREIAILVDAETGVAGKIRPGDIVDIYATFPGEDEATPPSSEIVVAGAEIIDVGAERADADGGGGFGEARVVPVTFALSVRDSLILTYVESFAIKVRLGLLAPGDDQPLPSEARRFSLPPGRGVPVTPGGPPAESAEPPPEDATAAAEEPVDD